MDRRPIRKNERLRAAVESAPDAVLHTPDGLRLYRLFDRGAPWAAWPRRALASSRLPVALDRWDAPEKLQPWLTIVRQSLRRIKSRNESLLIVEGTTGAELMQAVAKGMGLQTLSVAVAGSWSAWRRIVESGCDPTCDLVVSPPIAEQQPPSDTSEGLPCPDLLLWLLADIVEVLYVRRGGSWARWLRESHEYDQSKPLLCLHLPLIPTSVIASTLDDDGQTRGASPTVAWARRPPGRAGHAAQGAPLRSTELSQAGPSSGSTPQRDFSAKPALAQRPPQMPSRSSLPPSPTGPGPLAPPLWETQPTLVHWARAARGPWPNQSWDDFWMNLVMGVAQDRSTLGVLRRIIDQQRLIASGDCIRDQHQVVCFSALRPTQLSSVYRRHRRRWDRSGYGVVVSRDRLAKLGARPVIYGDDKVWRQLQPDLKPFFQSEGKDGRWRSEHEWRLPGDLSLSEISLDAIQIVVPSEDDRRILQPQCPWIVQVVQQSSPT